MNNNNFIDHSENDIPQRTFSALDNRDRAATVGIAPGLAADRRISNAS